MESIESSYPRQGPPLLTPPSRVVHLLHVVNLHMHVIAPQVHSSRYSPRLVLYILGVWADV